MPILVVDDDAQIRRLVLVILSKQGFQPLAAHDEGTALALVRQHAGQVTALVTDIHMTGKGGVELAQVLRAEFPRLPVLFLSTLATSIDELERAVPGCGFLQKPFRQAALVEAVRRLLPA
jgi:DNA-binding response OmpR family regulator